ncbi:MAG: histidinol-phosphate transaminase [Candidatus Omnitrophica bacterium]|nr:histidinol-phosphate transaminase [Candidatus Omnitrophota bacterium]
MKAIASEANNLNRYPDGNCFYLRQALAQKFKVAGNQIIFGNGSDEVIVLATRAFTGEGDEVIIAKPTFLIYEIAAKVSGATIRMVPSKDFRYDLKGMREAITDKTRIIFIANPDNPMGTYITQREAEAFLKDLPKNIIVFFDEAYYEFVDKKDYPDTLSLLRQYPNIILTRTFSKAYSLAGLRVSYGVASPGTAEILNRIREPFNINSLAQVAALEALKDSVYYRRTIKQIITEKKRLCKELTKLNLSFVESVTNFILINVKQDSLQVSQKLLRKGMIVREMGFWGLDQFIRVTVGTPKENDRFIKTLKEIL